MDLSFYRGKRVLITGHTGFKGTWLTEMLLLAGAKVYGYGLKPDTDPSLHCLINFDSEIHGILADIRDYEAVYNTFRRVEPEIVFHLAAQPLVRKSYKEPRLTYETNVMGTVNVFECVRNCPSVKSVVNVTTDKVYENKEWIWGYRENERLNGYDPYSNSKSCSELITQSYRNCFLDGYVAVSAVRAGNVIGGGDFAQDRIIPDCVRAAVRNEDIVVRHPHSIRPYQHVLEPLCAYLIVAATQFNDNGIAGSYNVGPNEEDCIETGELADLFVKHWGNGIKWIDQSDGGPYEANFLKLDCSKIKNKIGWTPKWNIEKAVEMTVEWSKAWIAGENVRSIMDRQIEEYLNG